MDELDFHVIEIVLMIFIVGLVVPVEYYIWVAKVIFIIPQGRIFVRAFFDYPKFGRAKGMYLLINESFVTLSTGIFIGVSTWIK